MRLSDHGPASIFASRTPTKREIKTDFFFFFFYNFSADDANLDETREHVRMISVIWNRGIATIADVECPYFPYIVQIRGKLNPHESYIGYRATHQVAFVRSHREEWKRGELHYLLNSNMELITITKLGGATRKWPRHQIAAHTHTDDRHGVRRCGADGTHSRELHKNEKHL